MNVVKNVNEKNLKDFSDLVRNTIENLDYSLDTSDGFITKIDQIDGAVSVTKGDGLVADLLQLSTNDGAKFALAGSTVGMASQPGTTQSSSIVLEEGDISLTTQEEKISLTSSKGEISLTASEKICLEIPNKNNQFCLGEEKATWTAKPTISENSNELVRGHELWSLSSSTTPATGKFLTNVTQTKGKIACEYSDSIDGLKWESIRFDSRTDIETSWDSPLDGSADPSDFKNYKNCTLYHWVGSDQEGKLPNDSEIGGFSLLNIVEKDDGRANDYFDLFQIGVHFKDFDQNSDRSHTPLLYRAGDEEGWLPGTKSGSWVELLDTYGGQTINGHLTIAHNYAKLFLDYNEIYMTAQDEEKWFSLSPSGMQIMDIPGIQVRTRTGYTTEITPTSVSSGVFYASSDKRLKTNITPYRCEKSILDLPIYEFDYIKTNQHTIGCLAQDLQEICPEIVIQKEDGYLSINESKLIYLLLEEVKQLNSRVKELEGNQNG